MVEDAKQLSIMLEQSIHWIYVYSILMLWRSVYTRDIMLDQSIQDIIYTLVPGTSVLIIRIKYAKTCIHVEGKNPNHGIRNLCRIFYLGTRIFYPPNKKVGYSIPWCMEHAYIYWFNYWKGTLSNIFGRALLAGSFTVKQSISS